jgi:hypothetical protein
LLEAEGYAVACAANGQKALDYLAKVGLPALTLLDLAMPVLSSTTSTGLDDFIGSLSFPPGMGPRAAFPRFPAGRDGDRDLSTTDTAGGAS